MKKTSFCCLLLLVSCSLTFSQRIPGDPIPGASTKVGNGKPIKNKDFEKIETLQRGEFQVTTFVDEFLFQPRISRNKSTRKLTSLKRNLTSSDRVYIVVPTAYSIQSSDGKFMPNENIEYVWELLETSQKMLIAVPVPVVESFGRVPAICECGTKPGRCGDQAKKFCFENLPLIPCTMKPMNVPDTEINLACAKLRTNETARPKPNFGITYLTLKNGEPAMITIFGNVEEQPRQNKVWAGYYQKGSGYFLENFYDISLDHLKLSRSTLNSLIQHQTLISTFDFGIKEKGIK